MKPYEIETARLLLRPLAEADVDELHALWSSPEVRKYLWDDKVIARQRTASLVEESLRLFAARRYGLWGARLHDRDELVGFGGFWYFHTPPKLELLYGVAPEHWNCGLATEIAQALIRYGFEELEFSEVRASTDAPNAASARVLEKAGLRFERRAVVDGLETLFYCLPRSAFSSRMADRQTPIDVEKLTDRLNAPIQDAAADGLKLALALLWERRDECPGAMPVIVCHDEIVVECEAEQAEDAKCWLARAMIEGMGAIMNTTAKVYLPVEVEARIVRSWGEGS